MEAMTDKIFIDREKQTGDFVMRMPEAAMPALYEMLQAAPLTARRYFYQVKQQLEDNYRDLLTQAGLVKPREMKEGASV